jgi:hypothetical protein
LSSLSLVRTWWRVLAGQEQALANAREAATLLSRRRVEREEVALFLEEHAASRLASVGQAVPR